MVQVDGQVMKKLKFAQNALVTDLFFIKNNIMIKLNNVEISQEKADQQRMAKVRILKRIAEENAKEGWVCDWEDNEQHKYFISYHHNCNEIDFDYFTYNQTVETGFYMSETVAGKLKKELLQDYKIMLGVE